MRRVTPTEEAKAINSILNSVRKTDEGEGEYAQLPIFQKGATSDNQDPVWKTQRCVHWENLALGCGLSDKFTYFHQGYDYRERTTGKVWASEAAMSYNLQNIRPDAETWRKIKASIPKSVCQAAKRSPDDPWRPMQLNELWVKLTDAQAAERTENSFRHTVCVPWERPQPSQLPQPPQPPQHDRKRVHYVDDDKANRLRLSGGLAGWGPDNDAVSRESGIASCNPRVCNASRFPQKCSHPKLPQYSPGLARARAKSQNQGSGPGRTGQGHGWSQGRSRVLGAGCDSSST